MISKKIIALLFVSALAMPYASAQKNKSKQNEKAIEAFDIERVRVTSPTILRVQRLAMDYIMGLDADRLAAPYLREAGLTPKAEPYPNWESTGLDGHIGGHYLSALSYMYAATGDKRFKERLDYMVGELQRAQAATPEGFLYGIPGGNNLWTQVGLGNIDAGAFSLNGKWVPLYNIHKTMAGLRDAATLGKNNKAKDVLIKMCRWFSDLVSKLPDEKVQLMLQSEHGGINEVYADLYKMTGQRRYLQFARRMTHNAILTPLLDHEDKLTGMHANTQIPKVLGIMRIGQEDKDAQFISAADYFWQNVVGKRSVTIGGHSVTEHFNPTNNFVSMIESEQGIESCNTYNMLRLTKMLFLSNPDVAYADFYERAMLNHILSTINTVQGGFVYFTPMRPGHYRVYSQPQTSMWCCVGSGIENHSRYGEMIYAHKADDVLYVNTFLRSTLDWKSNKVQVEQTGDFPWTEKSEIIVRSNSKKPKTWTLKIRRPAWTDQMTVTVGGEVTLATASSDGYFTIDREWTGTDTVSLSYPMHMQAFDLPDKSGYYSFVYGPMVLAADMGTADQIGLYADDSRGGHIAAGPKMSLIDAPTIILSDDSDTPLKHVSRSDDGKEWLLSGLRPEKYGQIKLVPFVSLSEHRYSVYFRTLSRSRYDKEQEELARAEAERIALEKRTTDKVTCGEQQPETDHQYKQTSSSQGFDVDGRHWRETKGWFSYTLKTTDARHIAITYRQSPNRQGRILCDDNEVGTLLMGKDELRTVELEIPQNSGEIVVRFEPQGGDRSPRIYEVRTVR